ncbi:MAG TPA: pantoate--beta-alanine ligase [Bacteroidia bacterium]|nr:pantoate--beta-alanine ligase [Bacteroidia bacterium]HNT79846.1 pantoate--beta-alanine ligase [Bacteroidia bacterium]
MLIFTKIEEYQRWQSLKNPDHVCFIPTMGALHDGHISLIEKAKKKNAQIIASIFVNPIQFNDQKDLESYPRTPEKDIQMLENFGCNVLFMPDVNEMYPDENCKKRVVELGFIGQTLEGEFRAGHFDGMLTVVKRFFDIIKPQVAYFGEKDFQQLKIIEFMVKKLKLPISIIGVPTKRESDGLAMSSRNVRLSKTERLEANVLYKALKYCRKNRGNIEIDKLITIAELQIKKSGLFEIDYFTIVESESLKRIRQWQPNKNIRAIAAIRTKKVRLLDNIDMSI